MFPQNNKIYIIYKILSNWFVLFLYIIYRFLFILFSSIFSVTSAFFYLWLVIRRKLRIVQYPKIKN